MKLFSKIFRSFSSSVKKKDAPARPFCTAVVPAAGASSRMGGGNKLFAELDGIPVIAHTLRELDMCPDIDEIIIVTRRELILPVAQIAKEYAASKPVNIVSGGATRQESVHIGVREASERARLVAVHDAARPLAGATLISRVVRLAAEKSAAIAGVPLKDTPKVVRDGVIMSTPVREELYCAQTPQVFDADLLRGAIQNASDRALSFTDDSGAVEALGVRVHIAQGSYENIKITTPEDIAYAQTVIDRRGES